MNENQTNDQQKLYCMVVNSQALGVGLESEYTFDKEGGIIGSSAEADWILTSRNHVILDRHCSITIIDNQYCLIDHSGRTYMNHANMPLEPEQPVSLGKDDVVTIGDYTIKMQLLNPQHEDDPLYFHKQNLSSIFTNELKGQDIIPENSEERQGSEHLDPLSALKNNIYNHPPLMNSSDSDSEYHLDAVIGMGSSDHEANYGDNDAYDYQKALPSNGGNDFEHLAMSPLTKGLNVKLNHCNDTGEMQYIAEEIGESLKEAIQGLLMLNRLNANNSNSVTDRSFQPIIDNPLKMGLSYEETVHLMLDSKTSLVHLSAPAAIKESLETLANHQKAVHDAIDQALLKILESLSPDRLMDRFNYYRSARNLPNDDRESWAWKMYQAYYQELSSSRQSGFKKLFWEIFEQAYDREMRTLQASNLN